MITSMRSAAVILALGLLAACGSSSNPPPPPAVPAAPTSVVATAGDGQVTLSWTASSGATSYNVYSSTSASVSKASGTKVTGATSGGAVTGLVNGTAYHFVVTAVNAGGESAESTPAVTATPTGPPVHAFDGAWVVCRNDGGPGATDYREILTIGGASFDVGTIDYATADLSCDGDGTPNMPLATTMAYRGPVSATLGAGSVTATKVDVVLPTVPPQTFYTLVYRDTAATPDALHVGDDSGLLDGSTEALRPIALQTMARALQSAPALADADGDWRSCTVTEGEDLRIDVAAGSFDYRHFPGPCTAGTEDYHSAGGFTVAGPVYASLGGTTVTALAVNLAETVPAAGNRFVTIWVDTSTTPRRLHQGNDTIHGKDGSTASLRPRTLFTSFLVRQ
jgi:hypothetical protein